MENKKIENPKMTIDIMDFLRGVLVKWPIIIASMVIFAIFGFMITPKDNAPTYECSAMAIVYGTGSAEDYVAALNSDSVVETVKESLEIDADTVEIKDKLSASVDDDNDKLISLGVTADTKEECETLAFAYLDAAVDKLNEIIDKEIAVYIDDKGGRKILSQGDIIGIERVEVVDDVRTTANYSATSNTGLNIIIFMILGAIMCLVVEFLLFIYNEAKIPVRYPDDIEKYLGLEAVAVVPHAAKKAVESMELVNAFNNTTVKVPCYTSDVSEACGMARLLLKNNIANGNVVAFLGTSKKKPSVNVALAVAENIGKSGKKVLYIDASMEASECVGVSELISDAVNYKNYISTKDNLDVITSGKNSDKTVLLENIDGLAKVVKETKAEYDFVIINTANAVESTVAIDTASLSDYVIVVVEEGKMSFKLTERVLNQIRKSGSEINGVVISEADVNRNGYYGRYFFNLK